MRDRTSTANRAAPVTDELPPGIGSADRREDDLGLVTKALRTLGSLPGFHLATIPLRVAGVAANAWMRGIRHPIYPELPVPRLTPRFMALVALDELVLGIMKHPGRMPNTPQMERVAGELEFAEEIYTSHGWLDDPTSYHRAPDAPRHVHIEHKRHRGVDYEHLTWDSGFAPREGEPGRDRWLAYEDNRTAHAYVLRHPEPDRPWVVCIHGHGTGVPLADFFAFRVEELRDELGYNVALPVLPMHGPRSRPGSRLDGFLTFDLMDAVHGVAQSLWDVRALIRWIRGAGGERIGVHGVSLGGYTTTMLAGIEDDLDFAMAGVPFADVASLYAMHAPPVLRHQATSHGLLGHGTHRVHRVISPMALEPRVPLERRAVYGGLGDRMSTARQAHRVWRHWGEPAHTWYEGNHVGFVFNRQVREFVRDRLEAWREAPAG